jgi:hypothetical protein
LQLVVKNFNNKVDVKKSETVKLILIIEIQNNLLNPKIWTHYAEMMLKGK